MVGLGEGVAGIKMTLPGEAGKGVEWPDKFE